MDMTILAARGFHLHTNLKALQTDLSVNWLSINGIAQSRIL